MTDETNFPNLTENPFLALARVTDAQPVSVTEVREAYLAGAQENYHTDQQMLAALEQVDALMKAGASTDAVYDAVQQAGVRLERESFHVSMAQRIVTDMRNHLVSTQGQYANVAAEANAFVAAFDRNADGTITRAEIDNAGEALRESVEALREVLQEEMESPSAPKGTRPSGPFTPVRVLQG